MSRLILDEHIDYLEFMAKCNKENPRFVEAVNEVVELIRGMESKLAHYEDLEEQGRLIVLPVATGEPIFEVQKESIVQHSLSRNWRIVRYLDEGIFGEIAFLTKEEAEVKMAELKGE